MVKCYYDDRKNFYQTCKRFSMNSKSVIRWVKAEKEICQVANMDQILSASVTFSFRDGEIYADISEQSV